MKIKVIDRLKRYAMKKISFLFKNKIILALFLVFLAGCTLYDDSETVLVNGESVTLQELQQIVKSIFHKNVERIKFSRWEKNSVEINCRVIGLGLERLALFQDIFAYLY